MKIYNEMFKGNIGIYIEGKEMEEGKWKIDKVKIRDFEEGRNRMVDDNKQGGGEGMVMKEDVVEREMDQVDDGSKMILMKKRGKKMKKERVSEMEDGEGEIIM